MSLLSNLHTKVRKCLATIKVAQLRLWIIILSTLFIVLIAIAICFSRTLISKIEALQYTAAVQRQDISNSKDVIDALVSGNAELAQLLTEEQSKSAEAETLAASFEEQIGLLKGDLSKQKESSDTSSVIQQWSGRVARIDCKFKMEDDKEKKTHGSGTITLRNGVPQFITNAHVLTEDGAVSSSCKATLPEFNVTLDLTQALITEKKDLAYVQILKPFLVPPSLTTELKKCTITPKSGDRVIVLGYPTVGADNTVTATEGIISGYDDPYYVSSAKLEQGNSGGAAILMKDNCYFGIPTAVVKGKIDSLARIMPL